jgi:Flp pilus assembly protein TadG
MMLRNLNARLKSAAAFAERKDGSAAIVMAILIPVLIGGFAFASEVSYWHVTKRRVQNAADTAAFAAGTQVRSGLQASVIEAAAEDVASSSGYNGGAANLTLEFPPSTAPNPAADGVNPNGRTDYVYVVLNETVNRNFTRMFNRGATTKTVQAAALAKISNGRPACILAMHASASGAISTGGSTTVSLNGCDIAANSISPSAIAANGNGSSVTADCISAVGNVSVNNTYHLTCPSPIANAPRTADPYAYRGSPQMTGCTSTNTLNQFPSQGSGSQRCYTGNGGAISIHNTVNLDSNVTYVFENTSSTAATFYGNGNGRLNGTNVTLYFKGKWDIKFNGNSRIAITAPTTGAYRGIAIFGDRNNEVDFDNTGNNAGLIVGAVYSPNSASNIVYSGSSTAYGSGQCTQVIGGTVTFSGNSNFNTSCANSGTSPILSSQTIRIVG